MLKDPLAESQPTPALRVGSHPTPSTLTRCLCCQPPRGICPRKVSEGAFGIALEPHREVKLGSYVCCCTVGRVGYAECLFGALGASSVGLNWGRPFGGGFVGCFWPGGGRAGEICK